MSMRRTAPRPFARRDGFPAIPAAAAPLLLPLLALLLLAWSPAPAAAADWPCFLGDAQ